jgi:hypothetical protein
MPRLAICIKRRAGYAIRVRRREGRVGEGVRRVRGGGERRGRGVKRRWSKRRRKRR